MIFNDYMNTLMGDPTTERLLPLIDAAAGGRRRVLLHRRRLVRRQRRGWWDTVGAWRPSHHGSPAASPRCSTASRAPAWCPACGSNPRSSGVNSPAAGTLPDEAFFQRDGQRLVEHGRYHLDLRHPAAVAHLDEVVDRLVDDLGVGYFKLDYNINPGPGTDTGGPTAPAPACSGTTAPTSPGSTACSTGIPA